MLAGCFHHAFFSFAIASYYRLLDVHSTASSKLKWETKIENAFSDCVEWEMVCQCILRVVSCLLYYYICKFLLPSSVFFPLSRLVWHTHRPVCVCAHFFLLRKHECVEFIQTNGSLFGGWQTDTIVNHGHHCSATKHNKQVFYRWFNNRLRNGWIYAMHHHYRRLYIFIPAICEINKWNECKCL